MNISPCSAGRIWVPGPDVNLADPRTRQMIEKSAYLNQMLRNAAAVRNDLGTRLVVEGRLDEAIDPVPGSACTAAAVCRRAEEPGESP